jgi:hypothetical protein
MTNQRQNCPQMVHRDKDEISDHIKEVAQMANEVKNFLQSR